MSQRVSPCFFPFSDRNASITRPRIGRWASMTSVGVLLLTTAYGCATPGSEFSTGGSTGTNSGGAQGSTGGSGTSTGGSGTSTGGSTGSGGDPGGTGTGGSTSGSGGNAGPGSGGTSGPGTGGISVATGGSSGPGTGGASTGSGGRAATGGSGVGTGGAGTGGTPATGGAAGPACPKPAGQICHEFLANDNSGNRVLYVNEFEPSKGWAAAVGDTGVNSPRTIEIVANASAMTGRAVLVSTNRGFGEFDLVNGAPLMPKVLNQSGVTGAVRIPNPANPAMQTTALGVGSTAIRTVNNTGVQVTSFTLPNGTDDLRAINRNPADGTFWFSKLDDVFQVSATGQMLWNANLGLNTKGYAVWWRDGGGAYATTGEPSTVVEIDLAKVKVRTVGTKTKFPELDFFSGFVRLANGNFVVANWLGHITNTADLNRPHIVEITPQDTIVWRWGTQAQARQITNVFVIR